MPSADFCIVVTQNCSCISCSFNAMQTSRGKTLNFPRVDAQFIKRIPIADGGLNGHVPTGPKYVTPHIGFLFVVLRFCVELPSDPASRQRPCPFANLRLCEYLIRGLSSLKLSAMLGTHACFSRAPKARRVEGQSPGTNWKYLLTVSIGKFFKS